MIEEIRKGIISKLKELFDIDIYSNDVVLKNQNPFFMVKIIKSERIPMLGNRFRLSVTAEILFFNNRDESSINEADNIIGNNMVFIDVLDRKVMRDSISMYIQDNKRKYTISYTVSCEEVDDCPFMESISTKEAIKIEL